MVIEFVNSDKISWTDLEFERVFNAPSDRCIRLIVRCLNESDALLCEVELSLLEFHFARIFSVTCPEYN